MDTMTAQQRSNNTLAEVRRIYAEDALHRERMRMQYLIISAVVAVALALIWARK